MNQAAARALAEVGSEHVASRTLPARRAVEAGRPSDLPDGVRAALDTRGVTRLYRHQRDAFDAITSGRDVLLTTGTASGKSLAYQMPIVSAQAQDQDATALLLFPTKALTRDQAGALAAFTHAAGLNAGRVATYDADTPTHTRPGVRRDARSLLTNPDMLHAGILPHHPLWQRFLENLRVVVVDELHSYRGVFGAHVAGVLRRLMRLAQQYGADPRVVATSATLGNPLEHAGRMLGRNVQLIDRDDAPHPERDVTIARTPVVSERTGIRRPVLGEAASIARALAADGLQVLMFAGSRQGVEQAVLQLRPDVPSVRSYRSGLKAGERHAIEAAMRSGTARVVVATNALELGIDVGSVDAVVLAGYPGSTASMLQQFGRAGRRDAPGLGVMVLGSGPMDQYLAAHPNVLFGGAPERALVNPDHLLVALDHLRCAAFERPLPLSAAYGGLAAEDVQALATHLADAGELHVADGHAYWVGSAYPAEGVSLRRLGRDDVTLQTQEGRVVGLVDGPSARWMVHPGAVYVHDGRPYNVMQLDLDAHVAMLRETDGARLTRANREADVRPAGPLTCAAHAGADVRRGEVDVDERVTGYRVIERKTGRTLSRHALDLPPTRLRTLGYAVAPDAALLERLRREGAWGSDANDYGPGWPRVKTRALERDGHACSACGSTVPPLHVHHRTPFRAFATAADANRLDNLVTLCPSCHRKAEREVPVRSSLAAVAHVLRSLLPIWLLVDTRDVRVQADPASAMVDGRAALVITETIPGGVGLVDAVAEVHAPLMAAAKETVAACTCTDGCPSCVGPAGDLGHGGKREALKLLAGWAS
jgi:DEAD/DEAH box helicase domain-containing protein